MREQVNAPERETALVKLLQTIFDSEALIQWVRLTFGPEVHAELPGRPESHANLAFSVTLAIAQRRLATREMFASLAEKRPRRADEIRRVAELWGAVAPGVEPPFISGSVYTIAAQRGGENHLSTKSNNVLSMALVLKLEEQRSIDARLALTLIRRRIPRTWKNRAEIYVICDGVRFGLRVGKGHFANWEQRSVSVVQVTTEAGGAAANETSRSETITTTRPEPCRPVPPIEPTEIEWELADSKPLDGSHSRRARWVGDRPVVMRGAAEPTNWWLADSRNAPLPRLARLALRVKLGAIIPTDKDLSLEVLSHVR